MKIKYSIQPGKAQAFSEVMSFNLNFEQKCTVFVNSVHYPIAKVLR